MRPYRVCERFSYEPGTDEFEEVQMRAPVMGVRDDSGHLLFGTAPADDADKDRALFAGAD